MRRSIVTFIACAGCLVGIPDAHAASTPAVVVALAKQSGISEVQAKQQIDQVTLAIKAELMAGRDVTITNFGKFYVQERDAHVGRNPKTGAPLQIEAKRYPRFVSADRFKDEMNGEVVKMAKGGVESVPQSQPDAGKKPA